MLVRLATRGKDSTHKLGRERQYKQEGTAFLKGAMLKATVTACQKLKNYCNVHGRRDFNFGHQKYDSGNGVNYRRWRD